MAGHSKWKNIQKRKNAQDSKRGKIFQKLSREIYVAAKNGSDPEMNPSLRLALDKAKSANMPNDNIERAIKRASDIQGGANYDEIVYEGYGPGGVGVLAYCLTDNVNRTATNVRVAFNHNGGSLGEKGSVAFQFERKGYIAIDREGLEDDEDTIMMTVLEAGAEDLELSNEVVEVYTQAADFASVRDALSQSYELAQAELSMVPNVTVPLTEDQVADFEKMLEAIEDDDDVTDVYHNADY
ncbi:YebC/PmpR family DNA-binding transcriptional regulator [Aerococcaceae bacterium WGS1372]